MIKIIFILFFVSSTYSQNIILTQDKQIVCWNDNESLVTGTNDWVILSNLSCINIPVENECLDSIIEPIEEIIDYEAY